MYSRRLKHTLQAVQADEAPVYCESLPAVQSEAAPDVGGRGSADFFRGSLWRNPRDEINDSIAHAC